MDDATRHWREPLTIERLCGWQAALFPDRVCRCQEGQVRGVAYPRHADADRERSDRAREGSLRGAAVQAPPARAARIPGLVPRLAWQYRRRPSACRHRASLVRDTAPFEDGNGRVGRAVIDLALAQDAKLDQRLYSVSRRLAENRNDYYAELAAASRGSLDITRWLIWFVGQFDDACRASEAVIDLSLAKARFWLEHRQAPLNERQRKAVNGYWMPDRVDSRVE